MRWLLLVLLAALVGCRSTPADPAPEAERGGGASHEEDLSPRPPLDDTPGTAPDGPWTSTSGPKTVGVYAGGKRSGSWSRYHPSGQPMVQGLFEGGQPVGTWLWFYDGGIKRQEGAYVDGVTAGVWRMWRPDGALLEEVTHKAGVPDGAWRMFHANGQVAEEMTWRGGKQEGLQRDWSAAGRLIAEGSYQGSRPVGTFHCYDGTATREVPAPSERKTPAEACGHDIDD